jgi:hypothetical protein
MLHFDSVLHHRLHVAVTLDRVGIDAMNPDPMSNGVDRAMKTAAANCERSLQ